jgi:hypothetical protein
LAVQLKTKQIDNGTIISKGAAQVFYVKKEDAGNACQKLYYEAELGDDISVEFFRTKEARIIEYDIKHDPLR